MFIKALSVFLLSIVGFLLCVTNPVLRPKRQNENIKVDLDRIEKDVQFLADIRPYRNYQNVASLNKAADYIQGEFEKLGMETHMQEYEVQGKTYKNVVASIGSDDLPRYVIGAHYDVCGDQPGADDNASAVAGLLEVARLIKIHQPTLDKKIDFVAYSLEEPPHFRSNMMGSAIHAQSLKNQKIDIELMVCLEMIGYYSDEENSQDYPIGFLKWLYPNKGNFIAVISKLDHLGHVRKFKKKMKQVADIDVRSMNAPKLLEGIDFSDHQNYWKHGFDAVMINNTAFYRNKNYHEITDTVESLDFKRMGEVIKGVYWALINY